jgi:hypothetical protein
MQTGSWQISALLELDVRALSQARKPHHFSFATPPALDCCEAPGFAGLRSDDLRGGEGVMRMQVAGYFSLVDEDWRSGK